MEAQRPDVHSPIARVKATIKLGSETYFIEEKNSLNNLISEVLISVKEQSMSVLKDFITKHNIPNDVSGEPEEEVSSEDDSIISPKPPVKKSKKLTIVH